MKRGNGQSTMTRGNGQSTMDDISVFSILASRALLAAQLGTQSYGGERDIYEALGYKKVLTYDDYFGRYERQDIAKAIIDRPIKATWRGDVVLIESNDDKETSLEKEYKDLDKRLKLKSRYVQLDKLTGLHKYGILLLGLSDVDNNEKFKEPVSEGKLELKYVKAFSDNTAKIDTYDVNPLSERYGLPLLYSLNLMDASGKSQTIQVHYTRIIHVIDDALESEIEGTPRLQAVFNRLMDFSKVVGGSAEMYWRGARPGYAGSLKEGYKMTTEAMDDLKAQINEFENNLRRILVNEGIDLKSLAQQVSDPAGQVDVLFQMVSSVTGIPKRILTGTERGELASSQDQAEWYNYVTARREEFAEPVIVRAFVDRCIELKILPKPAGDNEKDYEIQWMDLFSPSDKDKAEVGKIRATALKEYASNPLVENVIPMEAFFKFMLGLDEEQIELVNEIRKAAESEENALTPEEEEIIEEEIVVEDV